MSDLNETLRQRLEELQKMGRDIGKRINDASQEARETWSETLSPKLEQAEHMANDAATQVGQATDEFIDDLRRRFRSFRESLDK